MTCYHELVEIRNDEKLLELSFDELESAQQNHQDFYEIPQMSANLQNTRPWKEDPDYFTKAYVSALALMKMVIHARSGGNIEVMGMLTGKIIAKTIIVMDVYQLPVEGTETRVNAQAEGYEYMVQYLESLKASGHPEHIVGWYHSHPGYGCWLSGIDVGTQALNQNFQDPYLALVIDPFKTSSQNKVEIGAFRTYPEDKNKEVEKSIKKKKPIKSKIESKALPANKRQDFGIHSDKYYSLDIEIFTNSIESNIISSLLKDENCIYQMILDDSSCGKMNSDGFIQNSSLQNISKIIDQLKKYDYNHLNLPDMYNRKFENNFEHNIAKKLNQETGQNEATEEIRELSDPDMSDIQDQSDISDRDGNIDCDEDDVISVEDMKRPNLDIMGTTSLINKKRLGKYQIHSDDNLKLKIPNNGKLLSLQIQDNNLNLGRQELNELITLETQMKLFM